MKITARLMISLIIGTALVTLLFAYFQVKGEKRNRQKELEQRSEVLAESLGQGVEPLLQRRSRKDLQSLVDRFGNRQQLAGIAVYDLNGKPLAMTTGLGERLHDRPDVAARAVAENKAYGEYRGVGPTRMHVYSVPLIVDDKVVGSLAIFHDAGFIDAQGSQLWRDTFRRVLVQTLFIVVATLLIIRWTITGPISKMAEWMRQLRAGRNVEHADLPATDLFKPLTQEVNHFVKSLETARAAAEGEARLRESAESIWTPERLRIHVRRRLRERPLFVVSNREPYLHVRHGKSVEAVVPASGLVTALEPILRACEGTWVAHGSGDADREMVDARDRLRVPPDEPQYTLRRVWLTKEEEEGYYFGFANEGLWPLCHIAHTRPTFRATDWASYQEVNAKFAQALVEEMEGIEEPAVLIQDYHFALLPRLLKEKRPDARVAIFWHVPWQNPEAFGICPWQRELLKGLLGADLVGFHIQSHCDNFLETVDHVLESRIEWERFAANRGGHLTLVRPFPISVAVPEVAVEAGHPPRSLYLQRADLLKELGVKATFMGIGVERVDYTKGILERFRGIERFFEKYPTYQGQFTFVQIGAPSRTHIKRYHDFLGEVEAEADRINWRFQTNEWKPIAYVKRHHSHEEIDHYYKAADLCMVTSLHDGMNLVAKEFVAARDDEGGALILSRFTGASRELRDALVVNPYDIEQLAEAIRFALEMDPEEIGARMRRMRQVVTDNNIFRWAGSLIEELSQIRLDAPEPVKTHS